VRSLCRMHIVMHQSWQVGYRQLGLQSKFAKQASGMRVERACIKERRVGDGNKLSAWLATQHSRCYCHAITVLCPLRLASRSPAVPCSPRPAPHCCCHALLLLHL
jgi:hypothetical protein